MTNRFPLVLVPPSTALVNAWKNTQVPVGLLLLAALARRQPGVLPRVHLGPMHFPDRAAAEAAAEALLADGTRLVGISAWCHTLPAQLTLARAVRRRAPEVPIVFGGPQATAMAGALLEAFDCVDLVLRGETEASFPRLLRALRGEGDLSGVPGLSWRQGGRVVENAPGPPCDDLDALPRPAWDLLPPGPVAAVESGRGCPWACTFCSTSAFFARRHRTRSPASLIDELRWLATHRGVRHVTFTDDIFTVDKRAVRAFCEAFIAAGRPLAWGCSTRIDCVDDALLQLMAQAGCDGILYGVETGSARLQRVMGKKLRVERVLPTVEATRAAGITPYCTFIFGFPEETPEDLAASLALVRALVERDVRTTAQTLCVLPDTPYHREQVGALRFDGYTSLSRATLTADELLAVKAHPAIFSSFHHLDSPAAPRDFLIAATQMTNLLRHFSQTVRRDGFGDVFAALRDGIDAGRWDADILRGDFDEAGAALIGDCVADDDGRAIFALEAATLRARRRALAGEAVEGFVHVSDRPLEPLLAGARHVAPAPHDYEVRLIGDGDAILRPIGRFFSTRQPLAIASRS
ncbi:MAG: B12-binding domain-containing radical SAM protein [Myxococcales bacterium]|nr:B12-binding domain-containing radical SAM protein [Myxococcales bacterium]